MKFEVYVVDTQMKALSVEIPKMALKSVSVWLVLKISSILWSVSFRLFVKNVKKNLNNLL